MEINKNSGNACIVYTYSTLKTFNKYSKYDVRLRIKNK